VAFGQPGAVSHNDKREDYNMNEAITLIGGLGWLVVLIVKQALHIWRAAA